MLEQEKKTMRELVCPVRCHWAPSLERAVLLEPDPKHPPPGRKKGPPPPLRFQPAPEWSAAGGQQEGEGWGRRWRSRLNLVDTFPLRSPLLLSHAHTHSLTPNVNTLGLWQQCVCFFVLLDSCDYDCINALANEAHNEVCQQLTEDEGWKGWGVGGELGQGSRWGGSSQKREEWNPNLPTMREVKRGDNRRRWMLDVCAEKCWHFDLWFPRPRLWPPPL